ncbi:hypothetical protein K2173_002932 [Erythroxylum novogranatense]|uniref:Glutaredoxin domain-containing protein n=1 Tax=Erythroxylum novogranatense TaxID=1862640 RepID=A0AAV8TRB5_9ROSI|nr:hypothetical protein K2173_002932 [Erythroxylum novogranatense]
MVKIAQKDSTRDTTITKSFFFETSGTGGSDLQSVSPPESPKAPVFHRLHVSASLLGVLSHRPAPLSSSRPSVSLPLDDSQPIVVYITSLRIIRKTYEDCRAVRSILRGFRVPIDERDLSMDEKYIAELQRIMGSEKLSLPVVFVGGKYIGGAEELQTLYESGELKKLIGRLRLLDSFLCGVSGGVRFVVCERCSGSHKIYVDKYGRFKSCPSCNINIRSSSCSPVVRRRMSAT